MIRLTKNSSSYLHEELTTETSGAAGIRDEGLLDSALAAPFQSFEGHTPYSSLQQKAARLGYGLVKGHPFVDGNKRIGAHAMLVFLALNGVGMDYTQEELSDTFLDLAAGKIGFEELLQWVLAHEQ